MPNLYDPDAPEALVASVREFIAAADWRIAKTDTSPYPHSYVMVHQARVQGLVVGYSRLLSMIELYGFPRAWRNRSFLSIDLDGYSYWRQDLPDPNSWARDIVNRKPSEFGGWNARQPFAPEWARMA
jgi:hypothetical protein